MVKNWLRWVNYSLAAAVLLFFFSGVLINFFRPSKIAEPKVSKEKAVLPEGGFHLLKADYDKIGPPLLMLRYSPMTLQLPDLRNYLVYYGKNERPDAGSKESMLHFAFVGSNTIVSAAPKKPLYLVYDKDQPRIKYRFSPDNHPTSFWISATSGEKEAKVSVFMKNEAGKILQKPEQYAHFILKEREVSRFGQNLWEIGKWRVDGTLLARQRARWYGIDLFLLKHAGEEFKEDVGKQRIDFGQGEDAYSVYVGVGDALEWKEGRWKAAIPGPETQKYPLMVVQSVDERLMKLELWDVGGKSRVLINLIKTIEPPMVQNIQKTFKFVGARTRSQLMFEVHNKRVMIRPHDWLLYSNNRWEKLTTPKQIDDYVERKIVGPLFVVSSISQEDGKTTLIGILYNSSRSGAASIEIPLQQPLSNLFPANSDAHTSKKGADAEEKRAEGKKEENYFKKLREKIQSLKNTEEKYRK